jgi:hypothetical protein
VDIGARSDSGALADTSSRSAVRFVANTEDQCVSDSCHIRYAATRVQTGRSVMEVF